MPRICWINVYDDPHRGTLYGARWETLADAEEQVEIMRRSQDYKAARCIYRLYVKLKDTAR
jgi:hypothetical protein